MLLLHHYCHHCHCRYLTLSVLTSSSGRWLRMWQWKRAKIWEEWYYMPQIERNLVNKISYTDLNT
jgi:hypothetical protein